MLRRVQRYSVKDLLDMGIGDIRIPRFEIPYIIADLAKQQYRRGRAGSLGTITAIGASTQGAGPANSQWNAIRTGNVPAPVTTSGPTTGVTTVRQPVSYTFGTSGATAINQIAQTTTTVGTSATVNFNMVTWAFNVIGDASATFSAVKEWWLELLTTTQGGGASASAVLCGDHATNPWDNILDANGTYLIPGGGVWYHQDQTSAGVGITAGDLLKIVNQDASNIATIRLTAFGFK